MLETRPLRDLRQGQVGLQQQLLGPRQLHAEDLLVRGATEEALKLGLEAPPGLGHGPQHILHVDALAGMIANEAHRHGERPVLHGDHVGALPRGDADGRDEAGFGAGGLPDIRASSSAAAW